MDPARRATIIQKMKNIHLKENAALDSLLAAETAAEEDKFCQMVDKMMMDKMEELGKDLVIKAAKISDRPSTEVESIGLNFEENCNSLKPDMLSRREHKISEIKVIVFLCFCCYPIYIICFYWSVNC